MAFHRKRPAIDRFMEKVEPVPEAGCWLWIGATDTRGYGNFYFQGKSAKAHRVAMILHGREPGEYTCHKCDTPSCVNPDHLFAGTPQDNHDDMHRKGRFRVPSRRGGLNGRAKLSESDVAAIRDSEDRTVDLAARFGVTYQTIWQIRNGLKWRHVA